MSHLYRPKHGFDFYNSQHYAMRAACLTIDLRELVGAVEADATMKALPANLSAMNLCLALEAEIEYRQATIDPMDEFFQVDAHLDEYGEVDCAPMGGF